MIKFLRTAKLPLIFTILILISACGIDIPEDKKSYIGQWQGVGMTLTITSDGGVDYKRVGKMTTSVSGPIQSFEGNNFTVGISFITTTFEVSKAPYQADGQWKMVVDGVELTKVR